MGGSWEENEPLSDINVTPFVDVLLVLLIIFMVTAPIVNHVIQVDLPEDTYNQDKMKPMKKPLRLVIDKSGVLYIGNTRIGDSIKNDSQKVLEDRIKQWSKGLHEDMNISRITRWCELYRNLLPQNKFDDMKNPA